MDMYVRMYDELKRNEGDNPSIGILLCADTDADIARYSILKGNRVLPSFRPISAQFVNQSIRGEREGKRRPVMKRRLAFFLLCLLRDVHFFASSRQYALGKDHAGQEGHTFIEAN
jgi:hypothetical protein